MCRISNLLFTTILTLTFFQFAGCKKKPDVNPPNNAELCDITHISYATAPNQALQDASFTYNSYGNPVTVTVSNSSTGNPNVFFLYDKFNRLSDYVEPYGKVDPANLTGSFNFELWIRYTYADQNPNSLPIADTIRPLGFYNNGVFVGIYPPEITHYTYDSKGRIIQATSSLITPTTFSYDANGNLVSGPNVTYDDKVNFRRTNKIWMFVDRNYSVNNPSVSSTSYNAQGLPVKLPVISFLHRAMFQVTIDYSCNIKSYNN